MPTRVAVSLDAGEVIRVFGPAGLRVLDGKVMILGAVFAGGEEARIDAFRSYAVKALENSVVELTLEPGASIEAPSEGEEVLDEWVETADKIIEENPEAVVVALGSTDAGKSSFTALIANRGLEHGLKVGVIDADIGQADVGPPGFISAALVEKPVLWLRWLTPSWLRFIGSITPQRFERRIIHAVVELRDELRRSGANLIAVDTDGWVMGLQALEYKLELIRALKPDAVVVIGSPELREQIENALRGFKTRVYALRSPSVVRTRSRADRRLLRSENYKRFFEGAVEVEVDLRSIGVLGSCLFSGRLLPPEELERLSSELGVEVLAASEHPDALVVVVTRQPRPGVLERVAGEKQVYTIQAGSEKGLYVAILDENMVERAPGIIREIDYRSMKLRVYTAYRGKIAGIVVGGIRLSENFEEAGRVQRCPL